MDKRKENIINKVVNKQQEDLNFRRNFLRLFRQVKSLEKQIELITKAIDRRQTQLNKTIIEKDQWNNLKSEGQLEDDIEFQKFQIDDLKIALKYTKEDLINFIKDKSIRQILIDLDKYYDEIEEKYKKSIS